MKQNIENINKQLQIVIGKLIGKDYFKLEFGCFIFNLDFKSIHKVIYFNEYEFTHVQLNFEEDMLHTQTSNFSRDWEILGQEPTIADVLLAIQEKISALQPTKDKGIVCIWTKKSEPIYIDLEKSIFNQSPEVKQQLLNLISK